VADVEPSHRHNRSNDGCSWKPVPRPRYHHLHLRCDGNATLRNQLHGSVVSGRSASLELHGLPSLVHDRLSSAVRGMDRVHVGLHPLHQLHLRSVLPSHNDHRKLSGMKQQCITPLEFAALSVCLSVSLCP